MSGSRLQRPRHSRSTSHARTLPFPDLPVTPSSSRPASPRPNLSTSAPSASASGSSTPMGRHRSATAATAATAATVMAGLGRSLPSTASLSAVAVGSSTTSLGSSAPSGNGPVPHPASISMAASLSANSADPGPASSSTLPGQASQYITTPPSAAAPPIAKDPAPTPAPKPASVAAPVATHSHVNDHLYRSLLQGTCADIQIRIKRWGVVYHLHRMILTQAGFFHSLFLGGFSEGGSRKSTKRTEGAIELVDLTFDDPNITRAAFEICISRLYSNYPSLHVPTSLLPTPHYPLTAYFHSPSPLSPMPKLEDPRAQLATPHLLLSVIATAIYLGQTRVLREALALTLRTVGPWTVSRYLRFAIGESIGDVEWAGQDTEPARGLENLGRIIPITSSILRSGLDKGKGRATTPEDHPSRRAPAIDPILEEAATVEPSTSPDSEHIKCRGSLSQPSGSSASPGVRVTFDDEAGNPSTPTTKSLGLEAVPDSRGLSPAKPKEQGLDSEESHEEAEDDGEMDNSESMPHFYGFASNKIGEACACWLARWGLDVLAYEEHAMNQADEHAESSETLLHPPLRIWGHGGLPAKWLRATLSSDVLFVSTEMERYRVARRVVELRRKGWERRCAEVQRDSDDFDEPAWEEEQAEWEEEERELEEVFASGIFYTHIIFHELSRMSLDINPATGLPFVPVQVLQAAHWSAADLRGRILYGSEVADPTQASDGELGLAVTASDIAKSLSRVRLGSPRARPHAIAGTSFSSAKSMSNLSIATSSPRSVSGTGGAPGFDPAEQLYFPVPCDETLRVGDGGFLFLTNPAEGSSADLLAGGLPDLGPDLSSSVLPIRGSEMQPKPPMGESSYFGIGPISMTAREIEERWRDAQSPSPSYGPLVREKAGQPQRWTRVEPFRFSVEFWGVDRLSEKQRVYSTTRFYAGSYFNVYVQTVRKKDKAVQLGIYLHRQARTDSFPAASHPEADNPYPFVSVNDTNPPVVGEFEDPRRTTRAYFSISCASALGTALIRFSSAPDSFSQSQSWGWKSVSLRTEEYLSYMAPNQSTTSSRGPETLDEGVLGWVGTVDSPEDGKDTGSASLRATVVMGVI